jgi:hypothetical protein
MAWSFNGVWQSNGNPPMGCYVAVQHSVHCRENVDEFSDFVAVQQI